MHVPDGFLSPAITLPAYAAAAPLWALAARRHLGRDAADALPVVGALTALAFVVQTLAIPVPGGTSTHLVGVTLLALLYDPLLAFLCQSLVLLLQALFFGAGGVTVLAVNALAMGLLGPLAGWAVHRLLRRRAARAAAFLGAWVSMQVAAGAVALVLGLQHRIAPEYFPVPFAVSGAALLAPSLAVTGPVEGLYTLLALALLRRADLRGAA
ncbi:cobalamin (vitamin B12) biosynthesis CbiM protein [Anaeromyxobacter sp. K]|uniref:energy-coupling factor ABC transporter permease n=1 Tax=Anaeromyxobacter sp. (strain K) TaxID=447217 RepID=UPI00015F9E08|nr:energy-coupling factor ABC transporter permease [Anaeromyxobacter sp. K]ACG71767.1 cobalamin (vitamin B12) biosynthesis CbiM protein [Anaeromyxobacter sp. K]